MRIGIIGTRWGLMHVGGFRAAGATVTALCGQDPERTRQIAASEGIPLATTEVSALCAACDAVVVASPDALHHRHVGQALDAGRPVLCEKPLTLTVAEAEDLEARATTAAVVCAVCFPYRMLPPVAGLYQRVRERRPVHHLSVTLRSGFIARTGSDPAGPLLGASGDFGGASHVIDAALWLLGETPRWVQAALIGRPVHSCALQVGLESSSVLSLIHLAAVEPGLWGQWTLIGEGWEAAFAGGYRPDLGGWRIGPVTWYESGRWHEVGAAVQPGEGPREPWAEAHVGTARAFLAALKGHDRGHLASFGDGAQVQRVLASALRSECAEGRRTLITAVK